MILGEDLLVEAVVIEGGVPWVAVLGSFIPILVLVVLAFLKTLGIVGGVTDDLSPAEPLERHTRRRLDAQVLRGSVPAVTEERRKLRSRVWVHEQGWLIAGLFLALGLSLVLLTVSLGFDGRLRTGFLLVAAMTTLFFSYFTFWWAVARRHPYHGSMTDEDFEDRPRAESS